MKILKTLPIALGPLLLMGYGWYLGQLHMSGYDVAGILLFVTGAVGLVLALGFPWLNRKFAWHAAWFWNLLFGIGGCGLVFLLLVLFAWFFK